MWFRLAYLQQKYSILMVPAVVLVLLGARTWIHDTMKDTTQQLQVEIDSTKRMIQLEVAKRDSLNEKMDLMLRAQCINSTILTRRDLTILGLKCDGLPTTKP